MKVFTLHVTNTLIGIISVSFFSTAAAEELVCGPGPAIISNSPETDSSKLIRTWALQKSLKIRPTFSLSRDRGSHEQVRTTNAKTQEETVWKHYDGLKDHERNTYSFQALNQPATFLTINTTDLYDSESLNVAHIKLISSKHDQFGQRSSASNSHYFCIEENELRSKELSLPDGIECNLNHALTQADSTMAYQCDFDTLPD